MKFSVKLQEDLRHRHWHRQQQHQHQHQQQQQIPIIEAKVPIAVLNQPFLSSITAAATSPSDLSFSLSTHFPSGPCLKFSYNPTATTTPFSVSLKSGLGLFGSPHRSPLIFTAHLSLSPSNPNPIPTFSLHLKPQLGHFSLHKKTFSVANPNLKFKSNDDFANSVVKSSSGSPSNGEFGNGFVQEKSVGWEDLKLEPNASEIHSNSAIGFWPDKPLDWKDDGKQGFLSGITINARTALPLMKRAMLNLQWAANLPVNLGAKLPYLTVSKIAIESVEDVEDRKIKNVESNLNDTELLKGLCFRMRRDLEVLEKENREMKQCLEEIRLGVSARSGNGESGTIQKKGLVPPGEKSSEFEWPKSKRNSGKENGRREMKESTRLASDLESELQRAIKAASS